MNRAELEQLIIFVFGICGILVFTSKPAEIAFTSKSAEIALEFFVYPSFKMHINNFESISEKKWNKKRLNGSIATARVTTFYGNLMTTRNSSFVKPYNSIVNIHAVLFEKQNLTTKFKKKKRHEKINLTTELIWDRT